MDREPRAIVTFPVEFERLGNRVAATSENLSYAGIFVRTTDFLPIGEVVELSIRAGGKTPIVALARVAHVLAETAAAALGRRAGMGFAFVDQAPHQLARIRRRVDALIQRQRPAASPSARAPLPVIIAEPSTRLLERLSNSLGSRFRVTMASNGAEAYAACLSGQHELLLTSDELPIMDGWTLIRRVSVHPVASQLAVVMMSHDVSDIARLKAYRLGVRDFIQKPFTEEELALRLRNVAESRVRSSDHVLLRGKLAEIGLGTLLSLFEFEKKSGMLVVMSEQQVVTLFLADGRVVKVEPVIEGGNARRSMFDLLDWKRGTFEFIRSDIVGKDEIQMSTTQLLLEHARLRDEARR